MTVHDYTGETQGVRWRIRAIEHTYRGSPRIVLKDGTQTLGHYCAYVEVPREHVHWFESEVDVHGGVTWGGEYGTEHTSKYPGGGECAPGCEVLGWDYNHLIAGERHQAYERIESEVLDAVRLLVERMEAVQ